MRRGGIIAIGTGLVIGILCFSPVVWADPVVKEIYFSKLTTLGNGTFTLKFSLWDEEQVGNKLWEEEKLIKLAFADKKTVRTYLGEINPLDGVDFSKQLWVQVEKKEKDGTFNPIGSRDMLGVVPYALWALSPGSVPGAPGPQGPIGPAGPQGPQGIRQRSRYLEEGLRTAVLRQSETRISSGGGSSAHSALGVLAILLVLVAIFLIARGINATPVNPYPR